MKIVKSKLQQSLYRLGSHTPAPTGPVQDVTNLCGTILIIPVLE
jgi:hypothetical protein